MESNKQNKTHPDKLKIDALWGKENKNVVENTYVHTIKTKKNAKQTQQTL
jgi:hypothetical protein